MNEFREGSGGEAVGDAPSREFGSEGPTSGQALLNSVRELLHWRDAHISEPGARNLL